MSNTFRLSSGPHFRDRHDTASIMKLVCISLMPATIAGVYFNGIRALIILTLCIGSAVLSEYLFDLACHKPSTIKDSSAVVTGLLLGLSLSNEVPLYQPVLGAIFAIVVAKCSFGGLGKNFINPALAGRCFLLISFGASMTRFDVDGVSSATPLALLKGGKAVNITKMFLGSSNSLIGGSILALIIGGLFLWSLDIIHTPISTSVIVSFSLMMLLFGGQGFDLRFLAAHLCGGGLMMGALFMATDYTTSPSGRTAQVIYGCIIGCLGALFRIAGSGDSFSYAIIIGNLFTPLLDMYVVPKPYAYRKSAVAARNGDKTGLSVPKPVITLTLITMLAGVALGGVYSLTKDAIDEQKRLASLASYKNVLPAAESFENVEKADLAIEDLDGEVYGKGFGRVYINEAYVGKDASGNIAGYVVNVTSMDGYDGNITLTVGLEPDGTVISIAFTHLNETPGMGMRAGEPEFKDQFNGRKVDSFVLNKGSSSGGDNSIDTVSGASTTSGAVVGAVNAALDFFRNYMKGGN